MISAWGPKLPVRIEFLWGLRKGLSLFCLSVIFQYQFSWSVGNAIILFSRSILLANVSFGEMRLYWQGCIDAFLHFLTKAFNPHLGRHFVNSHLCGMKRDILSQWYIIVRWNLALKRRNLRFLKRHHNNILFSAFNTSAAGCHDKKRSGLLNFWHFYGSGRTHCRGKIGCVQASCELSAGFHWPFSSHIGHTEILSLSHRLVWDA